MEKHTEEYIKEGMKGIQEIDLQNRLRKFYQQREEIKRKKYRNMENLEKNLNLLIKVYEENLPLKIVERARRSGGVYKTHEEFSASVKKGEESISEEENEK